MKAKAIVLGCLFFFQGAIAQPGKGGKAPPPLGKAPPPSVIRPTPAVVAPTPASGQPSSQPTSTSAAQSAVTTLTSQITTLISRNSELASKFIRLSFHDCVGGCDGCIDMTNADNKGLDVPIQALAPFVPPLASTGPLSRADAWALAGVVSSRIATASAGLGNIFTAFKYGRVDCGLGNSTSGPDRTLPSPNADFATTTLFFAANFGLNANQSVALLGAHAIGLASRSNSGFDAQWKANPSFNAARFYASILTPWRQVLQTNVAFGTPNRFVWRHGANASDFMTDVDMSMAWDISTTLDATTGRVSCVVAGAGTANLCGNSAGRAKLIEYSTSNAKWINDFQVAFYKMVETVPGVTLTILS